MKEKIKRIKKKSRWWGWGAEERDGSRKVEKMKRVDVDNVLCIMF